MAAIMTTGGHSERDVSMLSGQEILDAMSADELAAAERRLVRRIDLRMGILVLVFLCARSG